MIADLWTIAWKEWKEFLFSRGSLRGGMMRLLVLALVFGVFLPVQTGRAWVESPIVLAYWTWVPLVLVTNVVADAFAGERERHTLETLLASRMPDRPILLGKVIAAVVYGWAVTMASLLLGLMAVNVVHGHGQVLLYPPLVALGGTSLSLLMAGLAASAGVLVSLRSPTVRQAAQTLSMATMFLVFVPIIGVNMLRQALPAASLAQLELALQNANWTLALLGAMAVLAAADACLLALAMRRFRRARLILD